MKSRILVFFIWYKEQDVVVYMLLNFENKILNHEIDIMDRFWNGKTNFSIVSAAWMVSFGFI